MARMIGPGWWSPEAVIAEVAANLWARRGRAWTLAALVAAVTGSLVWADLSTARDAAEAKRNLVRAGGTVVVVSREDGGLGAEMCTVLSSQGHVIAAGGTRRAEVVRFAHGPGTPFQSVYLSGDLIRVISPDSQTGDGVVIAAAAASELGVVQGSWVNLDNQALRVAGVVNTEPRAASLSRTIFLPTRSEGDVDQCWVEFVDGAFDDGVKALSAWFGVDRLTITPLVDRNVGSRDFAAEWRERPTRQGWMLGCVLVTACALLLAWRRRAELALYVLLGAARAVVALVQTIELWFVIFVGGLLGIVWGVSVASVFGQVLDPALTHGLRAGVLCLCSALALVPLASLWLVRADLVTMLKERPG